MKLKEIYMEIKKYSIEGCGLEKRKVLEQELLRFGGEEVDKIVDDAVKGPSQCRGRCLKICREKGSVPWPFRLTRKDGELKLYIGQSIDSGRIYGLLSEILMEGWKRKYRQICEVAGTFNNITLKAPNLKTLINSFKSMINNSVIVYDEFFNIVVATNKSFDDYQRLEASFEKCLLGHLFYYKQDIVYGRNNEKQCTRLLFPVLLNSNKEFPKGYLAIFCDETPYEAVDTHILNLFANAALVEMRRQLDIRNIEEKYVSDFLYDVIFRKDNKKAEIYRRARFMNVQMNDDYTVIIMQARGNVENFRLDTNGYLTNCEYMGDRIFNNTENIVHGMYTRDIVTKFDKTTLIIHKMNQKKKGEDYEDIKQMCAGLNSRLTLLFSGIGFQFGIGTVSHGFENIASSYHHAVFALSYGNMMYGEDKPYMVFYSESVLLKTFSVLHETGSLNDIIPESLKNLRRYDSTYHASLYETLKVYIENNCNAKKASEILFIHYKTMLYRLEKIKKDFGIHIDNNFEKFHIELGIQLMDIMDIRCRNEE